MLPMSASAIDCACDKNPPVREKETHLFIEIGRSRQVTDGRIDAAAEILKNHGEITTATRPAEDGMLATWLVVWWWQQHLKCEMVGLFPGLELSLARDSHEWKLWGEGAAACRQLERQATAGLGSAATGSHPFSVPSFSSPIIIIDFEILRLLPSLGICSS